MIKDLDKVLEYQNIDIKLRRTLDALEKCDDAKRMEVAKTEFNGKRYGSSGRCFVYHP